MDPKGTFQCGHCSTKTTQGIFCERHTHIWETLHPNTKAWIHVKIVEYNSKWFPARVEKRRLQHHINSVFTKNLFLKG